MIMIIRIIINDDNDDNECDIYIENDNDNNIVV